MGRLMVAPGVLPGKPAIFTSVRRVVKTLPFDVVITSWLRPGAIVAGTTRPSRHATGDATDLKPAGAKEISGGPGGTMLDEDSMIKGDQLAAALRAAGMEIVLWRTLTGGNHYNHIHTDNGGSQDILEAPAMAIAGPTAPEHGKSGIEGIPIVGGVVTVTRGIGDVVSFLFDEHGLLRIAEVVLGFGVLTIGAVAIMLDATLKSPAGKIALTAAGGGAVVKARQNPVAAAARVNEYRTNRTIERKAAAGGGDTSGRFQETKGDFSRGSIIEGSQWMKGHRSSEATRRRKTTTATKKAANAS